MRNVNKMLWKIKNIIYIPRPLLLARLCKLSSSWLVLVFKPSASGTYVTMLLFSWPLILDVVLSIELDGLSVSGSSVYDFTVSVPYSQPTPTQERAEAVMLCYMEDLAWYVLHLSLTQTSASYVIHSVRITLLIPADHPGSSVFAVEISTSRPPRNRCPTCQQQFPVTLANAYFTFSPWIFFFLILHWNWSLWLTLHSCFLNSFLSLGFVYSCFCFCQSAALNDRPCSECSSSILPMQTIKTL